MQFNIEKLLGCTDIACIIREILNLTPIEGREVAAFGEIPKPFFSICGALLSPQMTGTKSTPRLRSSVRNLSAFLIAKATVSFFPAKITYIQASFRTVTQQDKTAMNILLRK